ncbi:hypothetical protein GGE43_004077 [Agrobacterium tumefaciens]|uniref:Abasic site processing protein n=1 Tax=Agrobacterium radiobacter TaxID=362 RepID=A0ABR6JE34_AGRRD|nr:hypothetical protein [Agrobacterium radiobacter]MBB4337135.1 hypothetical protein [Agrobacterium radiobacter]MBB4492617.1 hypothetical protein [Agrobacterium radiobacter]MBB4497515.1 hypothetical protein [Agrobacterium radiobacter]MBB4502574.1 hypothetical protein [Agrobacterium radiobacter]
MTDANEAIQPVHNRMPVLLQPDEYEQWLHVTFDDALAFQKRTFPPELVTMQRTTGLWAKRRLHPRRLCCGNARLVGRGLPKFLRRLFRGVLKMFVLIRGASGSPHKIHDFSTKPRIAYPDESLIERDRLARDGDLRCSNAHIAERPIAAKSVDSIKKTPHVYMQRMSNFRKHAGRNAVRAFFIFLDLLEGNADLLAKAGLRDAVEQAPLTDCLTDGDINRMRFILHIVSPKQLNSNQRIRSSSGALGAGLSAPIRLVAALRTDP